MKKKFLLPGEGESSAEEEESEVVEEERGWNKKRRKLQQSESSSRRGKHVRRTEISSDAYHISETSKASQDEARTSTASPEHWQTESTINISDSPKNVLETFEASQRTSTASAHDAGHPQES
ncbi:hypothetical protein F8M41_007762 [Gigaspora margarita]|uniref:Uncharacterized protein n=1 Tax=Gigaspora margarita TaxID=4874 RepID=A0A8H4A2U4_GIGMA|nr:hypothetical protein F8M41_007762 [Gigaspora margarita]